MHLRIKRPALRNLVVERDVLVERILVLREYVERGACGTRSHVRARLGHRSVRALAEQLVWEVLQLRLDDGDLGGQRGHLPAHPVGLVHQPEQRLVGIEATSRPPAHGRAPRAGERAGPAFERKAFIEAIAGHEAQRQARLDLVHGFLDDPEQIVDHLAVVLQPLPPQLQPVFERTGIESLRELGAGEGPAGLLRELLQAVVAEARAPDRLVTRQAHVIVDPDKVRPRFCHCGVDPACVIEQLKLRRAE